MTGSLQIKKGYYYAVLNIADKEGRVHQKWIASGLPIKNNKRRAAQRIIAGRSRRYPGDGYTADSLVRLSAERGMRPEMERGRFSSEDAHSAPRRSHGRNKA